MPENTGDSHFSAGMIVDVQDGERLYLVIEYDSGNGKQLKFPGGTNLDRPGETDDETLHREVRKEIGLVFTNPIQVYEKRLPPRNGEGAHTKYGFVISFSDCSGEMRQLPIREDGEGGDLLSPPFWRTASELIHPEVYGMKKDDALFRTHIPMLESAEKYYKQNG